MALSIAATYGVSGVRTMALRRPSRGFKLLTRCAASKCRELRSSNEQSEAAVLARIASYVEKGLDPRVGRLLSSAEIPRVETAAWVLILLRGLESKPLDLETTLVQKEALLRAVTRRYMQPRKIWHPRGILEVAEEGVYLLPLGMQLGAPVLSNRVAKWRDLMSRFVSLESHICSSTGWKVAEIPQRIEAMYKQLPGYDASAFYDMCVVQIEEGVLDKEQMAALACVAEFYGIDYELRYAREPAEEKPTDQ